MVPYWIIESPSPRCFLASLVEIGTVALEKKIFKVVNVFLVLVNYLSLLYPRKRSFGGYIVILMFKVVWTNMNPLHSRMLCVKFGWNWHSGSGEEDSKFHQCIFTISLLSPLGKGYDPSYEQNWIPFTQVCFAPSLVEIGYEVLENKIFKFLLCIFAIWFPLEMDVALQLYNLYIFFSPKDTLC